MRQEARACKVVREATKKDRGGADGCYPACMSPSARRPRPLPCPGLLRAAVLAAALCASDSRAAPAPWETRFTLGGEVGATSFGIADVGLRKGALSLQLLTDTLELRYAPELARGRWFVALRAESFAAGLLISPWSRGAPDPTQALFAGYGGAEAGWIRYLPASLYAGAWGSARLYFFWARPETRVPVPGLTPLFSADAVLGRYTADLHVWLRAGADATLDRVAPHVAVEAVYRPAPPALAPRLELRAAWAYDQDRLMRTRLGGQNPYVVPLAGAGWAEWYVESYLALRLGLNLRAALPRDHRLELSLLTDVAAFAGQVATGFSLQAGWRYRRYALDTALGYAPWIERQPGVGRVTFYLLATMAFAPIRRRR